VSAVGWWVDDDRSKGLLFAWWRDEKQEDTTARENFPKRIRRRENNVPTSITATETMCVSGYNIIFIDSLPRAY